MGYGILKEKIIRIQDIAKRYIGIFNMNFLHKIKMDGYGASLNIFNHFNQLPVLENDVTSIMTDNNCRIHTAYMGDGY